MAEKDRIPQLQSLLREIHQDLERSDEVKRTFVVVCNRLIKCYLEEHDLKAARLVFDGLAKSKAGYSEISVRHILQGIRLYGSKADLLQFARSITKTKAPEGMNIYIPIIYAFNSFKDLSGARFYFAEMAKHGLDNSDLAYRAMFEAYGKSKQYNGVYELYLEMIKKGIDPTLHTYGAIMDALRYGKLAAANQLNSVYRDYLESGLPLNAHILLLAGLSPKNAMVELKKSNSLIETRDYNAFLSYCVKRNKFSDALIIYQVMKESHAQMDEFSYAIIMDCLVKDDDQSPELVFDLYDEMREREIKPDLAIFTTLLTACRKAGDLDKALEYLQEILSFGVKLNTSAYNALFNVLSSTSQGTSLDVDHACLLWDKMHELSVSPDTRTCNIFLSIVSKTIHPEESIGDDSVLWTSRNSNSRPVHEILKVYKYMNSSEKDMKPDFITYAIIINSLCYAGQLRYALQVYDDAKVHRVKLPVTTYNHIMQSLDTNGKVSEVMNIWHDLKSMSVLPDNDTYQIILETSKNARTKRFLKNREAKVHENPKNALLIRGSTTSQVVTEALKDLYALKRPNAVHFTKKNEIKPFEDESKLEFFSTKNDAAHLVVGTHLKKRPHNLTFIRMYNHQLLDMYEFGIENAKSLNMIPGLKCAVGLKPMLIFNGDLFESDLVCQNIKNYFLDFFNSDETKAVNLGGLEHVISFTAVTNTRILFRTYSVQLKKSGLKTPRVELQEMGPHYDLVVRRTILPKPEIWKSAIRVPKEVKPKKAKNIEVDEMGDKYGRIHLGKQNLSSIQTRKMKGLKRSLEKEETEETDEAEHPKKKTSDSSDS
ncbi:Brix domain-containing protein [Pilobolus umbonatus]|nr:Brix domain-containing protein [Pilobolus umbonatus]